MQKLDYIEKFRIIQESLKSDFFYEFYHKALKSPSTPFDFASLIPILFDIKSQYEIIKKDSIIYIILETLGANRVFTAENLTWLTTIFNSKQVALTNILTNSQPIEFFMFHQNIRSIVHLNSELFDLDNLDEDLIDSGKIVFRLIEEKPALEIKKLTNVLNLIKDLIDILSEIYGEDSKPQIYLLDSGSDSNIGVEAGIKVVQSVYAIFKEVWDSIFNRKYYKLEKDFGALNQSLSILEELKVKREQGVISEAEEQKYSHIIKTRVDNLLRLSVVPKKLYDLDMSNSVDAKLRLASYNPKLLGDNNKET